MNNDDYSIDAEGEYQDPCDIPAALTQLHEIIEWNAAVLEAQS